LEPDEEAWRKHRETLDAHLPFRDFEHARPTPDSGKRYVSVSGLPVFDETGHFIGYRGVGRHITDRKRAEAALRASEERWRRMFETSAAGMATARLDGVFTAANPALQRMLDRTGDEIVGHGPGADRNRPAPGTGGCQATISASIGVDLPIPKKPILADPIHSRRKHSVWGHYRYSD
jgi:PAS domain-containing protein